MVFLHRRKADGTPDINAMAEVIPVEQLPAGAMEAWPITVGGSEARAQGDSLPGPGTYRSFVAPK